MMSYDLIKYYYEMGVYSLIDVANCVVLGEITEEEFHFITGYNFQAIKNRDE